MTCAIPASWPGPGEELGFSVWVASAETTLKTDLLNVMKQDGTGIVVETRGQDQKLTGDRGPTTVHCPTGGADTTWAILTA